MNIKDFYWFQIRNRCPKCHNKLVKKGYLKDGIVQYYKCLNCNWGDKK